MRLDAGRTVRWGHRALTLEFEVGPDLPVALRHLSPHDAATSQEDLGLAPQPLIEILTPDTGRARASARQTETVIGRRMRHRHSESSRDGDWHELRIVSRDDLTGLEADAILRSRDGVPAFQIHVRVTNHGEAPVTLLSVPSFAAGFVAGDDVDLLWGDSEWLGEGRWTRRAFREEVPDLSLGLHGQAGRSAFRRTSTGTWSSGRYVPMGGVLDRRTGNSWIWQVEHNGAWRWEAGDRSDGVCVAVSGPADVDHQWSTTVWPGRSFTTVPVSVAVSADGLDAAVAALTHHRRALVRPHWTRTAIPVVFNDYMNTLMGDPTTAKLRPLVDAAAEAGAEIFCVDAGWYDEDGAWWDSVGEWQPSRTRFPGGLHEVLTHIRDRGMIPGLWLEPEVVGVRSPMADKLPPEAFLQRDGHRVVEHGRYHLDLRHDAAVEHLDDVVDRLVEQLGVGYLKLDYNIDPGPGTDLGALSPGEGLLLHNRAHLAWLDRVLDRHPQLVLENCASGGMRMDYALMSRLHLQSTSDQQDFLRYPPIAAAAPLAVLPEQAANWAYPQPGMSDEEIAFTMCTGLMGRLYLSGDLTAMTPAQFALVRQGVYFFRRVRPHLPDAVPFLPLGLPGWEDGWLALGLRADAMTWLGVWRRPGAGTELHLALPELRGRSVEQAYPAALGGWRHTWDPETGAFVLDCTVSAPSARIYVFTH